MRSGRGNPGSLFRMSNHSSILGLLLLLVSGGSTRSEPAQQDGRWRTLDGDGPTALHYALILPADFEPGTSYPVLLALPPGGQDQRMVEQVLELYFEEEALRRGWVVVSPAAPPGQSFMDGADERLPALLDAIAREVSPEGGGVHLAGVSNGGRSAFRLAGLHPERFLSLSVLPGAPSSAADEERLVGLAHLAVTLYVGGADEAWREAAFEVAERLEAVGAQDVLLEVREGEGHVVSSAVGGLLFERLDALRRTGPREPRTPEQRFFEWTRLQFAPEVHAARRKRLIEGLRRADMRGAAPGVFLAPSREGISQGDTFRQTDDFLYFTGLELPRSILALEVESGRTTLFVPERDARFESTARPNDFPGRPLATDPELARVSGVEAVRPIAELEAELARWIGEERAFWLEVGASAQARQPEPFELRDEGLAFEHYLRTRFSATRIEDASAAVARLRMVKGPEEIERIRRACAVTAAGIRAAAGEIRPGVDERTLEGLLEAAFKRGGAQRPAFDSIIKSGPNSLWPWRILAAHYDRRNRVMEAGELVLFDVGCEFDHYASDVGRTFPVSGRFTPDQARRLRLITDVSDAILAAVRPGVTLPELRAVAEAATPPEERRHMQTSSFFGHHIGLDVGDASLLEAPLAPGMVFTIEPWYYDHQDGVAVFLEDVVLVTEDGVENLTLGLPRGVEGLEEMVGGR